MDAFFTGLGSTVLQRWKAENFSLAKFPEIARVALEEQPPTTHVDLPAFVREFLVNDEQAFQTQSGFGQPEIVAYHHPRFYIQVLLWMDGTTDIHQHEFSGAFHVLAGSSIHARFALENPHAITSHFQIGDVRMQSIELLERGRTVPIVAGHGFVHSLFHLETPSVTVVVRTHNDPGTGPQFNYLPPHVALDPSFHDSLMARREQLLDVLEQLHDPTYVEVVLAMIAELDFARGFSVLRHAMGHLRSLDAWEMALAAFRAKHGSLADGVAATLDEVARRAVLVDLRSTIVEAEHRFFLALLLNVTTRDDLLALVAQRFPEHPPIATVMRWVEELCEPSDLGVMILDAELPPTLEIADDEQPEVFLAALRYFVAGGGRVPAALRSLGAEELAQLRAAFTDSSLRILIA